MPQAEKISLSCIYSALCPSERYHSHPPHMIPKLSVMFKKKERKKIPNHHSANNILHGHMFLCSLELNLLHNFSFRQMFLSGSAGKINSPGAVGRGRVARLSRVPGAHGHGRTPGSPFLVLSAAQAVSWETFTGNKCLLSPIKTERQLGGIKI